MKNWLVCGAALAAVIASTAVNAAELKVGDPAPNFKMVASDGKTYSLDQFKGKEAVVIAWYPKSFTGGCTKECKSMAEFGKDLRAYKVAYFTASCDPQDVQAKFATSLNVDYPILADPTKENAVAFGVSDGTKNAARWTIFIGKDGKILDIDKSVKTETHGKDIAAKLGTLGVEKKS